VPADVGGEEGGAEELEDGEDDLIDDILRRLEENDARCDEEPPDYDDPLIGASAANREPITQHDLQDVIDMEVLQQSRVQNLSKRRQSSSPKAVEDYLSSVTEVAARLAETSEPLQLDLVACTEEAVVNHELFALTRQGRQSAGSGDPELESERPRKVLDIRLDWSKQVAKSIAALRLFADDNARSTARASSKMVSLAILRNSTPATLSSKRAGLSSIAWIHWDDPTTSAGMMGRLVQLDTAGRIVYSMPRPDRHSARRWRQETWSSCWLTQSRVRRSCPWQASVM
jgi:hypothetical protein